MPLDVLSAIQYTIEKFDISGEQNVIIDLQNLRKYVLLSNFSFNIIFKFKS